MAENEELARGFAAWGGVTGVVYLLLLVAAVATIAAAGLPEQVVEREAFAEIARMLEGGNTLAVASMWLFNLAHVSLILFAAFLLVCWRPTSGWVVPGAVLVMVAAGLFIFETLLTIGLYEVAAPAVVSGAGGGVEIAADVLVSGRNHLSYLAGGLLGLGSLALGRAWLQEHRGRAWIGYVATIAGVLSVATAFTVVFPPLTNLRAPGFGLFALWCGVVGWRSRKEAVPNPAVA